MFTPNRRCFLLGSAALLTVRPANAGASRVTFPVLLRTQQVDGASVATSAFIDEQMARVADVFGEHQLAFEELPRSTLAVGPVDVVTRADRDVFGAHLAPKVINAFFVRSLMDVDEPGRRRMGVAWRSLRDPSKRYVLVSSEAKAGVLAHELGHFLGNGHSRVRNNVMSYDHDEGVRAFLDAAQASTARRTGADLFAKGELRRPLRKAP